MNLADVMTNTAIFDDITAQAVALNAKEIEETKTTEETTKTPVIKAALSRNKSTIKPVEVCETVPGDIADMFAAINDTKEIEEMRMHFAVAFDARIDYERSKENCTTKMISNFTTIKSQFMSDDICQVFVALHIDEGFVNRQQSVKNRFNVYAFFKVAEIARALKGFYSSNKTINCFMRSMIKCSENNVPFTHSLQLASLSQAFRISRNDESYLTRHDLSKATAKAQRSQMIASLEVFDAIASNNEKSSNNVIALKDTPVTRQLTKMFS